MDINTDNLIIQLLINAVVIMAGAYLLKGVEVKNFTSAFIAAVVLGLINFFIKPVLIILSLPINLITLGLFTWVINAFVIMLVDWSFTGFKVKNFGWALGFAIFLAILNGFITNVLA